MTVIEPAICFPIWSKVAYASGGGVWRCAANVQAIGVPCVERLLMKLKVNCRCYLWLHASQAVQLLLGFARYTSFLLIEEVCLLLQNVLTWLATRAWNFMLNVAFPRGNGWTTQG